MKTTQIIVAAIILLVVVAVVPVHAQGSSSSERRAFREHTNPQELVSIAPTTPMDKAITIISEVSKKFTNKLVIDTERHTTPINIDIQGMHWRDALETICKKNDLWYTEYESYIQITSPAGEPSKNAGGAGVAPVIGIQKEAATIRSREVKISAYLLETNISRIEEVGLNWDFMKSTKDFTLSSLFTGGQQTQSSVFQVGFSPKISFANIDILAKMFSNMALGELVSGPEIVVRSGEAGRIQVGQDFSVRERDFAGNLIDKFYSAGTIISVTPQVLTEQGVSFIHMNVEVERSDVQPGSLSTIVNKTKASTNLMLLDGEESIIGGLYSTTNNTIRTGIPFLKDLPWYALGLRYLFGYNKEETVKKELIILLKAELVPTLQERVTQKRREDGVLNRWRQEQDRNDRHVK